jgi:hyperosmotically inducible periplasmic protein
MNTSRRLALTVIAAVGIWGVAASPALAIDDTWITTKIRIALMTTDGAGRNAVKVDSDHGKVTLRGTVESEAVKIKAEATARDVGGVTEVRNLLQVVTAASHEAVKAADEDVEEAVEKALKADPSLEDVKVKSVDNGLVFLTGSATSLANKLKAVETAYTIAGVRQVATDIETKEK